MRSRSPFTGLAAVLLACLLMASPAGAAGDPPPGMQDLYPGLPYCGSFKAGYKIHVWAERTTCRNAVAVMKKWWKGEEGKDYKSYNGGSGAAGYVLLKGKYKGWRCTSGSGGGGCKKGKRGSYYQN